MDGCGRGRPHDSRPGDRRYITASVKGREADGRRTIQRRAPDQWLGGLSSLLLVAHRIDTAKTAMMTGTTKKGEVMCMVQCSLLDSEYQLPASSY